MEAKQLIPEHLSRCISQIADSNKRVRWQAEEAVRGHILALESRLAAVEEREAAVVAKAQEMVLRRAGDVIAEECEGFELLHAEEAAGLVMKAALLPLEDVLLFLPSGGEASG